jgi:hypothetical protein
VAQATNDGSVYFYLRDGNDTPIGYEDLSAVFNATTGRWEYNLDTTQVSDGDYVIWAKAIDECGNTGFSGVVSVTMSNAPSLPSTIQVTKCSVTAGSKENSDKISISGLMDATVDNLSKANEIQVAIDSNDMVSRCIKTFPIDTKSFKKGKYKYAKTESGSRKSFTYNTKTGKFAFAAKNIDLSGLGCPVTLQIKIGDYTGAAEVNEAIVNGKKPIPIKLMMGVKNSFRVDKIKVKHSTKLNSDYLSVKGAFAVKDTGVSMANRVSEDIVITLGTQTFTIPANSFKKKTNKFTCSKVKLYDGTDIIGIAAADFNFKTCVFTLTIKKATITAGSGSASFSVQFAGFTEGVNVVLP